ncbi:MAG: TIGR03915 family putative DNA repair protein [Clostridia bacterium]|nr:TIGR03915 family putative DNA repair protein [Clostridia bacterium]
MKIFIIDNHIDSLLSALFFSFTEKIKPDEVLNKKTYQPRLDAITMEIVTDKKKADRVKTALFKYGGDDVIAHIKVCMLSCDQKALTVAFLYAHFMLEKRKDTSEFLGEKCVSDFSYTVQKVLHERHIVSGFLRFQESSHGVMYAKYAPDNDITALLAPHFLRRLGAIPFIIHDGKRNKIAISNGRSIKIEHTDLPSNFCPSENEEDFMSLWRKYFDKINIKERPHLKQQDSFFPRRYRKYCFETWE